MRRAGLSADIRVLFGQPTLAALAGAVGGEPDAAVAGRRARGGGGSARRAERTAISFDVAGYIRRNIPNFEILNEEALQIIEWNADTVLEEVGVNFVENPEALRRWKEAGADVQGERVRIPRGLARKLCATAPSSFTQHARNPERNVEIGGRNLVLAPVYGPPFVRDNAGGRRYATLHDFQNFVKLGYMSKWLHHSGGTVCEPTDIPVNKRHLDMLHAHMVLSDKPYMGSVTEPSRAEDSVEMSKLLFGSDFVDQNTVMTSLININSPLTFDSIMMGALEVYAKANQAAIVSPFIVGGAMAPVTMSGAVALSLAEGLSARGVRTAAYPGHGVDLDLHRLLLDHRGLDLRLDDLDHAMPADFAKELKEASAKLNALSQVDYEGVMAVKVAVNKELEVQRAAKAVGGNLQAEVTLFADEALSTDLNKLGNELRFVLITSAASVAPFVEAPADAVVTEVAGLKLKVVKSGHAKCGRCWHFRADVGVNPEHPEICGRCVDNISGAGEVRHYA